ncbi:MAG: UDP-N-acetylglucosamine 1-carboxyvinyltransferase [Acetobacter sp.]|nr:UDP-N-acetylglucosamine 1-carboxyvinyltransferase [Acetobacter sp.]
MERFYIYGGRQLYGEIRVESAKNVLLPIIAASVMVDGVTVLKNVPAYTDICAMNEILEDLGAGVNFDNETLEIDTHVLQRHDFTVEQAAKMRSSIFLLGPLLARCKVAKVAYPGGCNIGLRPIDIHIAGLRQMGAKIVEKNGYIYADGSKMRGCDIILDFPSVGATENLMMAAVLTKGRTRIFNPAKEPEVVDLQDFLNKCGAKIVGAGCNMIEIEGVKRLKGVKYQAIPDRIITGTHLIAAAMCGGDVTLKNVIPQHNQAIISKLAKTACQIECKNDKIRIKSRGRLKTFGEVETAVYPGLPTDLQPQVMALQTISDGTCIVVENLFEARFKHVAELIRLGADIKFKGSVCVVNGKEKLYGADLFACDLRGGAGLVLAGLVADGYTRVHGVEFIDRGYYKLEETLTGLGADIVREEY